MTKIKNACLIARIDGFSMLVFGILSILCGLSDFVGFILGVCLAAIGFLELKFAGNLKILKKNSAKYLAINQCVLSLLVILYALYQMNAGTGGALSSQLSGLGVREVEKMYSDMSRIFYGVLIFIALFLWGGQALYYLTREKIAQSIANDSPPWILQMIRQKVI
jgi:hypothetical protein